MADRIVIMRDGLIEQIGAPLDVFERPGQRLRRRLHRLAGDEHAAGRSCRACRRHGRRIGGRRACRSRDRPPRRLERAKPSSAGFGRKTSSRKATAPTRRPLLPSAPPSTLTEMLGNETRFYTNLAGTEVISRMARPCSGGRRRGCRSPSTADRSHLLRISTVAGPLASRKIAFLASHQGGSVDDLTISKCLAAFAVAARSAGLGDTRRRRDRTVFHDKPVLPGRLGTAERGSQERPAST